MVDRKIQVTLYSFHRFLAESMPQPEPRMTDVDRPGSCNFIELSSVGRPILWFPFLLQQCHGSIDEVIAAAMENPKGFDFMFDEASGIVMLEMDMLYDLKEYEMMVALNESTIGMPGKRQAIKQGAGGQRWTNQAVPYEIDTNVFKGKDKEVLDKAMGDWMKFTCASYVGMQNNKKQDVLLAKGCRYKGTVIHELGHALGLHHEQTRPDRDQFVKIHTENIPDHLEYNFKKYSWSVIQDVGVPYDYSSIMHYGSTYFAEDKSKYTIETLDETAQDVIGNRKGLSFRDIKTVNLMYNCRPSSCRLRDSDCVGEGFVSKDCTCWCPSNAGADQDPYVISCVDLNHKCPQWATRGECYKSAFVKTLCEKSCRACGGDDGSHSDSYPSGGGYYPQGGANYPQGGANYPQGGGNYPQGGGGGCMDRDTQNCRIWASQGYCNNQNNINYMAAMCARSCNRCNDCE
ncbi:hypothetical protein BaRGS_00001142 [Batillaria attramentaria]|uniref:Metalloendopeptidase n=1 Tax=Batillaria attramentaria TaxID=370345 RepID=A0ABD0M7C6_9CAEN